MGQNLINKIKTIIDSSCIINDLSLKDAKININICSENDMEILLLKLDDVKDKIKYFIINNKNDTATPKHVDKMCDYILFCLKNDFLYVFSIELKEGNNGGLSQLLAGSVAANFIINTSQRILKTENNQNELNQEYQKYKNLMIKISNSKKSNKNYISVKKHIDKNKKNKNAQTPNFEITNNFIKYINHTNFYIDELILFCNKQNNNRITNINQHLFTF